MSESKTDKHPSGINVPALLKGWKQARWLLDIHYALGVFEIWHMSGNEDSVRQNRLDKKMQRKLKQ